MFRKTEEWQIIEGVIVVVISLGVAYWGGLAYGLATFTAGSICGYFLFRKIPKKG